MQYGIMPGAAIEKILRDNSARGGFAKGPRVYKCTAKLEELLRDNVLFSAVYVVEAAWSHYREGRSEQREASAARSATMVGAVGKFVLRYRDDDGFDDNLLAEKLSGRSPLALLTNARNNAATTQTTVGRDLAEKFLAIYNSGRRTRALPPFTMPRKR